MPKKTHTHKVTTKRGGTHVSQNVKVTVNTAPPPRRRRRRRVKKDPAKEALREAAAQELMEAMMAEGGGGGGGSAPGVAQVSTPGLGAIEGAMTAMERRILAAEARPGPPAAAAPGPVAAAAPGPVAAAAPGPVAAPRPPVAAPRPPAAAAPAPAPYLHAVMAGGGGGGAAMARSPLSRRVRFDPSALSPPANALGASPPAWDDPSGRTGPGSRTRRGVAQLQREAVDFEEGALFATPSLVTRGRAYSSELRGAARPPVYPADGSHPGGAGAGAASKGPGTPSPSVQKCMGRNKKGTPCKKNALPGKKYCRYHRDDGQEH